MILGWYKGYNFKQTAVKILIHITNRHSILSYMYHLSSLFQHCISKHLYHLVLTHTKVTELQIYCNLLTRSITAKDPFLLQCRLDCS